MGKGGGKCASREQSASSTLTPRLPATRLENPPIKSSTSALKSSSSKELAVDSDSTTLLPLIPKKESSSSSLAKIDDDDGIDTNVTFGQVDLDYPPSESGRRLTGASSSEMLSVYNTANASPARSFSSGGRSPDTVYLSGSEDLPLYMASPARQVGMPLPLKHLKAGANSPEPIVGTQRWANNDDDTFLARGAPVSSSSTSAGASRSGLRKRHSIAASSPATLEVISLTTSSSIPAPGGRVKEKAVSSISSNVTDEAGLPRGSEIREETGNSDAEALLTVKKEPKSYAPQGAEPSKQTLGDNWEMVSPVHLSKVLGPEWVSVPKPNVTDTKLDAPSAHGSKDTAAIKQVVECHIESSEPPIVEPLEFISEALPVISTAESIKKSSAVPDTADEEAETVGSVGSDQFEEIETRSLNGEGGDYVFLGLTESPRTEISPREPVHDAVFGESTTSGKELPSSSEADKCSTMKDARQINKAEDAPNLQDKDVELHLPVIEPGLEEKESLVVEEEAAQVEVGSPVEVSDVDKVEKPEVTVVEEEEVEARVPAAEDVKEVANSAVGEASIEDPADPVAGIEDATINDVEVVKESDSEPVAPEFLLEDVPLVQEKKVELLQAVPEAKSEEETPVIEEAAVAAPSLEPEPSTTLRKCLTVESGSIEFASPAEEFPAVNEATSFQEEIAVAEIPTEDAAPIADPDVEEIMAADAVPDVVADENTPVVQIMEVGLPLPASEPLSEDTVSPVSAEEAAPAPALELGDSVIEEEKKVAGSLEVKVEEAPVAEASVQEAAAPQGVVFVVEEPGALVEDEKEVAAPVAEETVKEAGVEKSSVEEVAASESEAPVIVETKEAEAAPVEEVLVVQEREVESQVAVSEPVSKVEEAPAEAEGDSAVSAEEVAPEQEVAAPVEEATIPEVETHMIEEPKIEEARVTEAPEVNIAAPVVEAPVVKDTPLAASEFGPEALTVEEKSVPVEEVAAEEQEAPVVEKFQEPEAPVVDEQEAKAHVDEVPVSEVRVQDVAALVDQADMSEPEVEETIGAESAPEVVAEEDAPDVQEAEVPLVVLHPGGASEQHSTPVESEVVELASPLRYISAIAEAGSLKESDSEDKEDSEPPVVEEDVSVAEASVEVAVAPVSEDATIPDSDIDTVSALVVPPVEEAVPEVNLEQANSTGVDVPVEVAVAEKVDEQESPVEDEDNANFFGDSSWRSFKQEIDDESSPPAEEPEAPLDEEKEVASLVTETSLDEGKAEDTPLAGASLVEKPKEAEAAPDLVAVEARYIQEKEVRPPLDSSEPNEALGVDDEAAHAPVNEVAPTVEGAARVPEIEEAKAGEPAALVSEYEEAPEVAEKADADTAPVVEEKADLIDDEVSSVDVATPMEEVEAPEAEALVVEAAKGKEPAALVKEENDVAVHVADEDVQEAKLEEAPAAEAAVEEADAVAGVEEASVVQERAFELPEAAPEPVLEVEGEIVEAESTVVDEEKAEEVEVTSVEVDALVLEEVAAASEESVAAPVEEVGATVEEAAALEADVDAPKVEEVKAEAPAAPVDEAKEVATLPEAEEPVENTKVEEPQVAESPVNEAAVPAGAVPVEEDPVVQELAFELPEVEGDSVEAESAAVVEEVVAPVEEAAARVEEAKLEELAALVQDERVAADPVAVGPVEEILVEEASNAENPVEEVPVPEADAFKVGEDKVKEPAVSLEKEKEVVDPIAEEPVEEVSALVIEAPVLKETTEEEAACAEHAPHMQVSGLSEPLSEEASVAALGETDPVPIEKVLVEKDIDGEQEVPAVAEKEEAEDDEAPEAEAPVEEAPAVPILEASVEKAAAPVAEAAAAEASVVAFEIPGDNSWKCFKEEIKRESLHAPDEPNPPVEEANALPATVPDTPLEETKVAEAPVDEVPEEEAECEESVLAETDIVEKASDPATNPPVVEEAEIALVEESPVVLEHEAFEPVPQSVPIVEYASVTTEVPSHIFLHEKSAPNKEVNPKKDVAASVADVLAPIEEPDSPDAEVPLVEEDKVEDAPALDAPVQVSAAPVKDAPVVEEIKDVEAAPFEEDASFVEPVPVEEVKEVAATVAEELIEEDKVEEVPNVEFPVEEAAALVVEASSVEASKKAEIAAPVDVEAPAEEDSSFEIPEAASEIASEAESAAEAVPVIEEKAAEVEEEFAAVEDVTAAPEGNVAPLAGEVAAPVEEASAPEAEITAPVVEAKVEEPIVPVEEEKEDIARLMAEVPVEETVASVLEAPAVLETEEVEVAAPIEEEALVGQDRAFLLSVAVSEPVPEAEGAPLRVDAAPVVVEEVPFVEEVAAPLDAEVAAAVVEEAKAEEPVASEEEDQVVLLAETEELVEQDKVEDNAESPVKEAAVPVVEAPAVVETKEADIAASEEEVPSMQERAFELPEAVPDPVSEVEAAPVEGEAAGVEEVIVPIEDVAAFEAELSAPAEEVAALVDETAGPVAEVPMIDESKVEISDALVEDKEVAAAPLSEEPIEVAKVEEAPGAGAPVEEAAAQETDVAALVVEEAKPEKSGAPVEEEVAAAPVVEDFIREAKVAGDSVEESAAQAVEAPLSEETKEEEDAAHVEAGAASVVEEKTAPVEDEIAPVEDVVASDAEVAAPPEEVVAPFETEFALPLVEDTKAVELAAPAEEAKEVNEEPVEDDAAPVMITPAVEETFEPRVAALVEEASMEQGRASVLPEALPELVSEVECVPVETDATSVVERKAAHVEVEVVPVEVGTLVEEQASAPGADAATPIFVEAESEDLAAPVNEVIKVVRVEDEKEDSALVARDPSEAAIVEEAPGAKSPVESVGVDFKDDGSAPVIEAALADSGLGKENNVLPLSHFDVSVEAMKKSLNFDASTVVLDSSSMEKDVVSHLAAGDEAPIVLGGPTSGLKDVE